MTWRMFGLKLINYLFIFVIKLCFFNALIKKKRFVIYEIK